ncbi:MAG: hypothetical protein AB6733_12195 [Clostridiaceae bacterium]
MKNSINIDETIKKAAKEAIKEFDKEKKSAQKKKIFHNTKLLMQNYNKLKEHLDFAVDDAGHLIIDTKGLTPDDLYILSIKRSKGKTAIMLAHIDVCMDLLKESQRKKGTSERYEAFKDYYINGLTYEDIQKKYHCSKNTPGRWIALMLKDLGVYLFGIEGIKMD